MEAPVSLIDIYPTLMDLAGRSTPAGVGWPLALPELTGQLCDPIGCSASTTTRVQYGEFMLRRGPWKYIAYVGYEPMLLDLTEDPDEVRNWLPRVPRLCGSGHAASEDGRLPGR